MNTTMLPHRRAGQGVPFVMVHGFLGGSAQWEAEIARFSDRFDVIAPDLPGFGDASDQAGCNHIGGMASRIIELLNQLGVDKFNLMGHSMGGMIVQEMAARVGVRISRLILYGTGPLGLMPDRFEPIEASKERLKTDGVVATVNRIGATWFCKGTAAAGFPLVAQIGARANPQAAMDALDAMADWDGRPALETLQMPSLIVWGDEDRSYRWPQVETLWKTLPDVRLSVIPGASHAAHLEKPQIFQIVLEDFLCG